MYTAAVNSPPQQDDDVPVSVNPAYRQVTSIALQENSAYSVVPAQYKNIGDRKHVNDKLSESTILWECQCNDNCLSIAAATSLSQDEVPVSANPAYRQVTSVALQENSAYSIVHTVSPPAAVEYENI